MPELDKAGRRYAIRVLRTPRRVGQHPNNVISGLGPAIPGYDRRTAKSHLRAYIRATLELHQPVAEDATKMACGKCSSRAVSRVPERLDRIAPVSRPGKTGVMDERRGARFTGRVLRVTKFQAGDVASEIS